MSPARGLRDKGHAYARVNVIFPCNDFSYPYRSFPIFWHVRLVICCMDASRIPKSPITSCLRTKSATGSVARSLHGRSRQASGTDLHRQTTSNNIIRQSLLQRTKWCQCRSLGSLTAVETNNVIRQPFSDCSSGRQVEIDQLWNGTRSMTV